MRSNSEELQRRKRDAYLSKDWRRTKPSSSSSRSWFSFCSLCPSSSSSSRTSFFFALDFKQPSSLFFVFSHSLDATTRFYNNKSFRLASSCALYIIRLILTRALRSTVVGVMLSLFPTKRRSGGSTLEEKLVVAGFFSQTLNPKRKRKISQKLNCNFQTHTHRNALKRFSYNTREEKYAHFSLEKDERILSAFVFLWCITHTRYKLCFFSARV